MIQRWSISMLQTALSSRRARAARVDLSPPAPEDPETFDRLRALFGAVMTLVMISVVLVFSALEVLTNGHTWISMPNIAIFLMTGLIIVLWLVFRGTSDRFGDLFRRAAATPDPRADEGHPGSSPARTSPIRTSPTPALETGSLARRFFKNLWVPVTLQFLHAGWLVYASGGLAYSQYYMVPAVMMLIGQSVYATPPVDLLDAKPRNVLVYAGRVARAYWYPVVMVVCVFALVVVAQEQHPLISRAAPQYEHYLTMLVELISGIFVVHFTRRADQRMLRRAPGAIRL